MNDAPRTPSRRVALFDGACAATSFAVPLSLSIARVASTPQWRADLPLVRAIGLVGGATSAATTTALVQLVEPWPVGTRTFRAGLVAAIGLGLVGLAAFRLARRALSANVATPALAAPLAAIAALTTTLAATAQAEGTIAGGATVGAAIALFALGTAVRAGAADARVALTIGAALGAAFVENAWLGAALAAALVARRAVARDLPRRADLVAGAAGALIAALVIDAPTLTRALSSGAWSELGRALGAADLAAADVARPRVSVVVAYAREVGAIALLLATLGAALGTIRRRMRATTAMLLLVVAADVVFPVRTMGALSADPLAALHLVALAAAAVLAAIGVQSLATTLVASGAPLSRAGAVLLVVFDLSLVAVVAEEGVLAFDRSDVHGADAWTDDALLRLPPRAAILVRSRALAFRLFAARVAEGARPDALVVPRPLLGRGRIASDLLDREARVAPLLRDVAVKGGPSENALTTLTDARPLHVDLDPGWDRRLVGHLVPDGLWMRFAAEPLGGSDRRAGSVTAVAAFSRVVPWAETPDPIDVATRVVLVRRLHELATFAAIVGERETAARIVTEIAARSPGDAFAAELTRRMLSGKPGPIDVSGLLD